MKRFIEGEDRAQITLLPECLDDYVAEDNPVRVVEVFVDQLDLRPLGFEGAEPATTGRPSYHPSVLLKIYIYGYLNPVRTLQSQPESGRCSLPHSLVLAQRSTVCSLSNPRNIVPQLVVLNGNYYQHSLHVGTIPH